MILLKPLQKEINGKEFVISRFPALAGLEIATNYAASGFPNIKDYLSFESNVIKLMAYVGVPREGQIPLLLSTRGLIDNHVSDWRMLIEIQKEMMEYNKGFLEDALP